MAEETTPNFEPGITGNITDPQSTMPSDPANYAPFYGEQPLVDNSINFPTYATSSIPSGNVNPIVGSPGQPVASPGASNVAVEDYIRGTLADFDSTEGKRNFAKIYSYDSGPSSNAFYDRYAAFGSEKLREVGFSPIRDNEANFNANTTWWDNTSRMLTHSFMPLAGLGLKSSVKSLGRMLQGDFTGSDLEEAREYEYYSALGQDSRGGFGAFMNNAFMNFGYTAGIITEAVAEELVMTAGTALTGGALGGVQAARSATLAQRLGKASKLSQMPGAFKSTLKSMNNLGNARKFWNGKVGRFINPFENTRDALKGISRGARQGQNLTMLAKTSKTVGGFYRDVRNVNMALAEARLESGMVINSVYDEGYREFYNRTGRAPNNDEQRLIRSLAEKKGAETLTANAGLIYLSNKIVFNNITRPRGGLSKFMRNTREEIYEAGGGKFGNLGKVVYDNAKKSFAFERNNLKNLAKSWWKNPGFKTAGKTIGYFKANVAEGLQENAQEAIARANEESAREALNSSIVQTSQYSNGVNSFLLKDSVADERTSWAQYSKELGKEFSARGFETFATGFVMGAFAGPLNNAVPFISTQYNRMYNKAEYAKWVQTKTKITEDLVQELNNVDIKDFLNSKMINLGKQDVVSNIKDSQGSSTKEILDSDNESFIQQVKLMNETKSTEVFIDKLKSMQELTDKELLDAIPGDKTNDAGFYRERINKSINKLKTVQEKFDQAQEMFPNPIPAEKLQQLDKSNTYEYNKQVALHMAWEQSVENYVFFSESFEDVTKRMSKIQNSYIEASYGGPDGSINIGQADYGAAKVLFKPEDIGQQKTLLEQEIDIEEQKANKNTTRINALKDQIKSLDAYEKAFLEFRKYNIRGDFKQQARNILQAQKAEGEVVTEEEVDAYLDEELGSADDQVLQGRIFKDLKSAHHNYLKAVAGGVNATMRTSNLDKSFEDLLDYYKLGQEARSMTDAINILHEPSGFLEAVDRNQKWIKRLYDRRSEYYTKLVNDQISLIEDNAFLNQLANQGLYISSEDFVKYKEEGTLPDEIFDNNNKVVYKKGTPQYERIYKELFIPYENLKDLTVKEATLLNDEIFNAKLVDLNKMYDEKINNLPLEPTRVSLQLFEEMKIKDIVLNN